MSTFTNPSKNSISPSNTSKNSASFTGAEHSLYNLLIDDTYYLLLDDSHKLIIDGGGAVATNLNKS